MKTGSRPNLERENPAIYGETEQMWNGWELCVESAFQTPYFGGEYSEDVAEHLQQIVLGNSDHAAADMCVLYDSEENGIRDTNTIYHKQCACGTCPE